jgi:4-diphosphocytidyl-2C-methyl-D-erythritol kinase
VNAGEQGRPKTSPNRDAPAGSSGEGEDGPRDWASVLASVENDFERVVPAAHAEISASMAGLREEGARAVLLSGSGAASFGVFDDAGEATAAAERLSERLGWPFAATRTRASMPEPTRLSSP